MADKEYLTPEESLQKLSDDLVSSIIGSDTISKSNRQLFFGHLTHQALRDENYVIVAVLNAFKDKNFTPDEKFIKMYLTRNLNLLKKSQEYIDINAYADLDENPLYGYIVGVLKQYVRLQGIDPLLNEEFLLTLEKYKSEYSTFEASKALSQAKLILYDGLQVGKRLFQGYEDSIAYFKNKVAEIESLLDRTTGAGFINSREMALVDDDNAKPEKIGDFDLIEELNEHLGGVYTGQFLNVMAPTKGGKTKFVCRLLHTAMVKYGTNCSAWAFEGGYKAFWAQMRAIHYEYMYIRNSSSNKTVVAVSQKDILYDNFPNEQVRALEAASRLDLFTNINYGNLYMIDRPFVLETFIEEIDTSVKLNNSRMVVIDYLQLISSLKLTKKSEYIGKAYQVLLDFCKKRNVGVCSPSQFKQEFVSELSKAKDGQSHEVRTAGGESAEIVRTPDINIALYASTEDILRKEMSIMSIPSRLAEPFPTFKIYADLCSCLFASIKDDSE